MDGRNEYYILAHLNLVHAECFVVRYIIMLRAEKYQNGWMHVGQINQSY